MGISRQRPPDHFQPMASDSTICLATYGNGVQMAGRATRLTKTLQQESFGEAHISAISLIAIDTGFRPVHTTPLTRQPVIWGLGA